MNAESPHDEAYEYTQEKVSMTRESSRFGPCHYPDFDYSYDYHSHILECNMVWSVSHGQGGWLDRFRFIQRPCRSLPSDGGDVCVTLVRTFTEID